MFDVHGQSETDLFHLAVRKVSERRELKRIVDRNLSAWSTSQGLILLSVEGLNRTFWKQHMNLTAINLKLVSELLKKDNHSIQ